MNLNNIYIYNPFVWAGGERLKSVVNGWVSYYFIWVLRENVRFLSCKTLA